MQRLRYIFGVLTLLGAFGLGWLFLDWTRAAESAALRLRVEFADAGGLRRGASVRTRGVVVGVVDRVGLRSDGEAAVVEISLDEEGARFARDGSRFWIVRPRVGGLSAPVDGLDTLIRDPYVTFEPARLPSEPLEDRETIVGAEVPPRDDSNLAPIRSNDLLMTLLCSDAYGLTVGSAVRYRGSKVGDVRAVELPESGTGVIVRLRIDAEARRTVTDASSFWVARPTVDGSLLEGFSVSNLLSAVFPYVTYSTPQGEGVPVTNGARIVEVEEPPEVEPINWPDEILRGEGSDASGTTGVRMVEVLYEAEEGDWLNSNDRLYRKSVGVLYRGRDGASLVLTTRAACDAAFVMSDWIGSVDIEWETIRAINEGNRPLGASRRWTAGEDDELDLAVVQVEWTEDQKVTEGLIEFGASVDDAVTVVGQDGQRRTLGRDGFYLGDADSGFRGGALLDARGRVVGLASVDEDGNWRKIGLDRIPTDLRPEEPTPDPR
ncbi:MAG: MlaD family protein [Planctomycetota bacterium]